VAVNDEVSLTVNTADVGVKRTEYAEDLTPCRQRQRLQMAEVMCHLTRLIVGSQNLVQTHQVSATEVYIRTNKPVRETAV